MEGKDKRRGGARGGRPDTAAGGDRKRGGPRPEGAAAARPRTAAPRDDKAPADGKRGDDGAGRGRRQPNPPDPSSWQYKFKNRERGDGAKKLKLDGPLTAETELPKMIPKEELINRPDREQFDKDMVDLEAKAREQLDAVKANRAKKRAVLDGGRGRGDLGAMGEEIGGAIAAVKKHRAAKRELIDSLKEANEKQRIFEAQRDALMKSMPSHCRDERSLAKELKETKKRYERGSLSGAEEKQVIKQIDQLKVAVTEMKKFTESVAPKLDALKAKKVEDQKKLDVVKKAIDELDEKINAAKSKADETRGARDNVREEADKYNALIEEQNDEITRLYSEKDKRREKYFEQLFKHEEQQDYIHQLRIYMNQQKRLRSQDDDRSTRIAERRKQIESISNKNTKAIDTCEDLILYCQRLQKQFGLQKENADEAAAKAQAELIAQQRAEALQEKLQDGRLQMAESKKDDVTVIGGTGGKGKKNRNRNKKQATEGAAANTGSKSIPVDLGIISKFNIVMMSPPQEADQLEDKIEELKKKAQKLIAEGDTELKAEKEHKLAQIEELVDNEIKAEMEAAFDDGEEEEKTHERMARRGGRGRGGRGGGRGGRPQRFADEDDEEAEKKRQQRRKGQPKGEFEEASDDEEEKESTSLYSKPRTGGGQRMGGKKQKKQQQMLAADDDDEEYPTLL